jgi:hypothetical protein
VVRVCPIQVAFDSLCVATIFVELSQIGFEFNRFVVIRQCAIPIAFGALQFATTIVSLNRVVLTTVRVLVSEHQLVARSILQIPQG